MSQHGGRRSIAVLNATTEFHPLTWTPVDTAAADFARITLGQIALMFGLPAYMLGAPTDSSTYANVESRMIELYQLTLLPWIGRIEAVLDAQLPPGHRGAHRDRRPVAGRHEDPVRDLRDRPRQGDLDRRRGAGAGGPPTAARSAAAMTTTSSTPRSAPLELRVPDASERIVEGIVVPWGETSFLTPDPKGERFLPGSLIADDRREGRPGQAVPHPQPRPGRRPGGRVETGSRRSGVGRSSGSAPAPTATTCWPRSATACSTRSRSGSTRSAPDAAPTGPARSSRPACTRCRIAPIGAYDGARVLAMRTPARDGSSCRRCPDGRTSIAAAARSSTRR